MITAQVKTPMSKDDPNHVKVEEISLPPPEMWAELNNASAKAPAPEASVSVEQKPRDEEVLEFVSDPFVVVPLKFPFRFRGAVVDSVTVRRLTIGQVSSLVGRVGGGEVSTFDIYAQMTALPAPVLRGMISDDGTAVTNVAYGFLPRSLRGEDE